MVWWVLSWLGLCLGSSLFAVECYSSCESNLCLECVPVQYIEGYAYPCSKVPCNLSWGGYFSWVYGTMFEENFSIASEYAYWDFMTVQDLENLPLAWLYQEEDLFLPKPLWKGYARLGMTVDNGRGVRLEGSWLTLQQEAAFSWDTPGVIKPPNVLTVSRVFIREPTRSPNKISGKVSWDVSIATGTLGQSFWFSPHFCCTFTTAIEGIFSEILLQVQETYENSVPKVWKGGKTSEITTTNQLVGPGIGLSPAYYLTENVAVYGGLQAFLLYGEFAEKQKIMQHVANATDPAKQATYKFEDIHFGCAPAWHWCCGVHFGFPLMGMFPYISVDLGWEGSILYNHVGRSYLQYRASEPGTEELDKDAKKVATGAEKYRGILYMEGLQVRCEVSF